MFRDKIWVLFMEREGKLWGGRVCENHSIRPVYLCFELNGSKKQELPWRSKVVAPLAIDVVIVVAVAQRRSNGCQKQELPWRSITAAPLVVDVVIVVAVAQQRSNGCQKQELPWRSTTVAVVVIVVVVVATVAQRPLLNMKICQIGYMPYWSGFGVSIVFGIATHVCRWLSVFLLVFWNCHKFLNSLYLGPHMIETPLWLSRRLIIWWLLVEEQIYTLVFAHFMNRNITNMVNSCMSRRSVIVISKFCNCTKYLH